MTMVPVDPVATAVDIIDVSRTPGGAGVFTNPAGCMTYSETDRLAKIVYAQLGTLRNVNVPSEATSAVACSFPRPSTSAPAVSRRNDIPATAVGGPSRRPLRRYAGTDRSCTVIAGRSSPERNWI